MLNFYIDNGITEYPFVFKKLYQRLNDNFHESSFGMIRENSSKLRTYALFKTEPGIEKYLTDIKNITMRQEVTKFRLSNHRLAIETGRHDGVEPDKRFCPFCLDKVENESHFLLICPVLRHLRKTYLTPVTNSIPGFEFFPENFKLKALLVDMKYEVCKFIAEATELRNFLASKPKTMG